VTPFAIETPELMTGAAMKLEARKSTIVSVVETGFRKEISILRLIAQK